MSQFVVYIRQIADLSVRVKQYFEREEEEIGSAKSLHTLWAIERRKTVSYKFSSFNGSVYFLMCHKVPSLSL